MLIRGFPFIALGIVLLTIATRLPSLQHPQAIDDEVAYSVVANEIVDGGRPYIDAVDRKPPLLFWTYAAVFEVAGKYNWMALHAVALVWTLGTMAGLYVIGRQLFNRETGLIAALLYSIFQPWAAVKNLAFNGEMLMNLPLVWAWAIAFGQEQVTDAARAVRGGRPALCGISAQTTGSRRGGPAWNLSSSSELSNEPGHHENGVHYSCSDAHRRVFRRARLRGRRSPSATDPARGVLLDVYERHDPARLWDAGILHTLAFIGACLPLIIGAALAIRDRDGLWVNKNAERIALLGLLAASAVGAPAGARFYPHYYIQLIPPPALLAAPHYAPAWFGKTRLRSWFLRLAVISAWLAITVVAFFISHWKLLALDREPSETARYLTAHSAPNDRIFVWGRSAAEVYL